MPLPPEYPATPDGRYFVVRGRLWRLSDPSLDPDRREAVVRELMDARRTRDRARVDAAKRALGERGPVWWTDGAPDWNRHLAKNSSYADWFAGLQTPPATTRKPALSRLAERRSATACASASLSERITKFAPTLPSRKKG